MKTALITGVTGQDGSYQSELLLGKDNEVHGINNLMIVAHPDDEMIWGGHHLLKERYLVVCLTYLSSDNPRGVEFKSVMEATGSEGVMLGYPDVVNGEIDRWKVAKREIESSIEYFVNLKDWNKIITHNPEGEYDHVHHVLTSRIVTSVVKKAGKISSLSYFGPYYKIGDNRINRLERISADDLKEKERILLLYQSQENSRREHAHMYGYEQFVLYADWNLYAKGFWEKKIEKYRKWPLKKRFRAIFLRIKKIYNKQNNLFEVYVVKNSMLQKEDMGYENQFIYNRFDIFSNEYYIFRICSDNLAFYVEGSIRGNRLLLGVWLLPLPVNALAALINKVFQVFPQIKQIRYQHSLIPIGQITRKGNHYKIHLPNTEEELHNRLSSKHRYNLKREIRLIENEIGAISFVEYNDNIPESIVEKYFSFKNETHGINYHMTPIQYLKTFHVTTAYVLFAGDNVLSIIFSCEQCDIIYIENLTYDPSYSKYSPGQVLYDHYLVRLIEKGKKEIYLSGGNLAYKQRYGSEEEITWEGVVFRNNWDYVKYRWKLLRGRFAHE